MRRSTLPAVCVTLLLSACMLSSPQADQPARIIGSTNESRVELQGVVSKALHVTDVNLADDALRDSSWLVIERNRVRTLENAPLSGRDLGQPERFQLVVADHRCVLVHERDGGRYKLSDVACVAE